MVEVAAVAGHLRPAREAQRRSGAGGHGNREDGRAQESNEQFHLLSSGIELEKGFESGNAGAELVANALRPRKEGLLVAGPVERPADGERTDRGALLVEQRQLDLVSLALFTRCCARLDRGKLLAPEADAPEARRDDRVLASGRPGVNRQQIDLAMPQQRRLDQLLRVRPGGRERLDRIRLEERARIERAPRKPVANRDGSLLQ